MGKLKYTMHNIILPDGSQSLPGRPVLAETKDVKDMIEFAKKRVGASFWVVDLGAGEGGYSIAFAQAGFRVIAVEPRDENIRRIQDASHNNIKAFANLTIVKATVEQFCARQENFPRGCLVLCLGLLYHLPNPALILGKLSAIADAMILNTHYAIPKHWQYDGPPALSWVLKRVCKVFPGLFKRHHYGLSPVVEYKGQLGRWYPEYGLNRKTIDDLVESSVHNCRSFWLTVPGIEAIAATGGLGCFKRKMMHRQQRGIFYFVNQY